MKSKMDYVAFGRDMEIAAKIAEKLGLDPERITKINIKLDAGDLIKADVEMLVKAGEIKEIIGLLPDDIPTAETIEALDSKVLRLRAELESAEMERWRHKVSEKGEQ
jgi:hypothetical protein